MKSVRHNSFFHKKEAGYFTIEAAFLLPFIMMIIVFMTFLSFYCYDRCILEQCAYAAALRGSSNRFTSNEEAYEEAQKAAESLVSEKLFAVNELETVVQVSGVSVTVTYECGVNMPIGNLLEGVIGDDILTLEVSKKVLINKPVAVLRQL